MSPAVVASAGVLLSWNNARLIALILNAVTGLLNFYDGLDASAMTPDDVFALRVVQGNFADLSDALSGRGLHREIFATMRNLSLRARGLADKGAGGNLYGKVLNQPWGVELARHVMIDDSYRWNVPDRGEKKPTMAEFRTWMRPSDSCQKLLVETCHPPPSCWDAVFNPTYVSGFELVDLIFFNLLAERLGCEPPKDQNVSIRVLQLCTNTWSEMMHFRRDKKKLARIDSDSLTLLAEQVFACSQFGFVEFVDIHLLVTMLAWQHPKFGCYTPTRPEAVPNTGIVADLVATPGESQSQDRCLRHLSRANMAALTSSIRFLVNPSPWPEYHSAADQVVAIDRIVAEDHFATFKYVTWVQDAPSLHHVGGLRPPQPPPIAWAPDLVAFVALLFVIVLVLVLSHGYFSSSRPEITMGRNGRRKPFYPFAYKKL